MNNMSRVEELLHANKIAELLNKKEVEEKKKNTFVWVMAIIGVVVAVAAVAYAIHRFLTPDYLEDFEDDLDDEDFDDDFFDDDEEDEEADDEETAKEEIVKEETAKDDTTK